jgi:PAS domain S-box-containing protein
MGKRHLNKYESELNAILNSTHNAIISINKEGNVNIINPAAEKIIGIRLEDAAGRHISEVIPNTNLLEVLKTGKSDFGKKLMIGDRVVITNRSPVLKNNEIVGAVAVFQDVSEIESILRELDLCKKLSVELSAIIESSYDGIYVTDGNGVTICVNSAYERITGVKREEVLGRHMRDLEKAGFYSKSVTLLVLEKKRSITIMQQIKGKKNVMVTGNPVFGEDGEITLVVTNVRDMTELNRLNIELEKTRKLTQRYHSELIEMRLQQVELDDVIARSDAMKEVLRLTLRVAKVDSNVLITGESGVGKEIIAKLIHKESDRREGPFIKINCGAIPENLLESELFGYEGGAFTGAKKEGKPGLFEVAEKGVLLLDEIAELPKPLQVKLLRAIQDLEINRLGSVEPRKIDVRIIASTNKDLEKLVSEGKFREDLFYRLNVVPIFIPPLRDRKEDIIPLLCYYVEKYNKKYNLNKQITSEIIDCFLEYNWPGNVRELENVVERLIVIPEEDYMRAMHLPKSMRGELTCTKSNILIKEIVPLSKAIQDVEEQLILNSLEKYKDINKVAKVLGVHRTTIARKIARYNIGAEMHDAGA